MFKVIGSDNREYGPASEEVLRRWIAEGRANGATQVQKEGETAWRSLSSFPEFAEALAAGAAPPPTPEGPAPTPAPAPSPFPGPSASSSAASAASSAAADAEALSAQLLARDVTLDIGACVQRSWELLQKHFWLIVAAWAVVFFIEWGICLIPYVGLPAGVVLGAVMLGGLHGFFLRLLRGEPASVADVFSGFGPSIGPLILCGIVSSLLSFFGFVLCILPGIYLVVCWHPAPLLILDRRLEAWPAMEISRKVVTRNWFGMFGLAVVAFLLCLLGSMCCGVLLFLTGPIASGAMVEAYRRLFEAPAPAAPAAA